MSRVHDTIQSRRTIHDYLPEPVPEAAITRALECAHAAPCHKATWPWRFVRVGPEAREKLLALNTRLKSAKCALSEAQEARLRAKMLHPHALVAVTQVLADDPFRQTEDYAATACAIQNLCLSLADEGIGTKWSTGAVTRHPETLALLGIDPAVERSVGWVWIGRPAREHPAPRRPPVSHHIRSVA